MNSEERQSLQRFVIGKRIEGLRLSEGDSMEDSLELLFDDVSALELFSLPHVMYGNMSYRRG